MTKNRVAICEHGRYMGNVRVHGGEENAKQAGQNTSGRLTV